MAKPTTPNAKFDTLLDAEQDVRGERVTATFGADMATRERAKRNLEKAQQRLNALIGALSLDETRAYGAYRREVLGENAAR